jgi:hypothetical protein
MSSPMTAGIVALMLEANPLATPQELKMMMAETAIKDTWTTANPDPNIWGVGKINAYGMFENFFFSSVSEEPGEPIKIFPNPTADQIFIEGAQNISIFVSNLMGKMVAISTSGESTISLDHLTAGMYIIRVISEENELIASRKILKH